MSKKRKSKKTKVSEIDDEPEIEESELRGALAAAQKGDLTEDADWDTIL